MFNFLTNFAASCTSQPNFFGIPPWYKYLLQNGKINAECELVNFELMDIWLILSAITEIVIYIAGVIAVVMIIWGGFRMITSQGSPDTIKEARQTILYAIIGLVVSISARAFLNLVNGIF